MLAPAPKAGQCLIEDLSWRRIESSALVSGCRPAIADQLYPSLGAPPILNIVFPF